ncbi:aminoacetone oxidase family FAD-binding enzyme [Membranihabitans maritimus]|uniref:aminoacetone oxidase family FAD-binding enzyme n=1 Tax=Membranihabitans maritimus TaxID=2904244 RepID=UPI001F375D3F|nr:aminoacetone oxidase family FAD-binding enzyme [Membranihabitans maritimus]
MKIAIIGGGAAGFFVAANLHNFSGENEIIIFEQGKKTLQKVKISGGGRCNVTHACWTPHELIKYYPRGSKELLGPFTKFCCGDTIEWFEKRGVPLKIEEDGRVFPQSNESQSIINCLEQEIKKNNVHVKLGYKWTGINPINIHNTYEIHFSNGQKYEADRVVISTGGNVSSWRNLERMSASIVSPVPSLFTFNIADPQLNRLAGISIAHSKISIDGVGEESGPLLITHWGMSGPVVLKMSSFGALELAKRNYNFMLKVQWAKLKPYKHWVTAMRETYGKKIISNAIPAPNIPKRLWDYFLIKSGIDSNEKVGQVTKEEWYNLYSNITCDKYKVKGKSTFKEEFVTAGGIDLKEINFRNFEFKKSPGIFSAGEILNIDAITGGFNFQNAWTGAYIIADYLNSEL